MKAWDELNAMERAEVAERLPKWAQEQMTFPQIGQIWNALRAWVNDAAFLSRNPN